MVYFFVLLFCGKLTPPLLPPLELLPLLLLDSGPLSFVNDDKRSVLL